MSQILSLLPLYERQQQQTRMPLWQPTKFPNFGAARKYIGMEFYIHLMVFTLFLAESIPSLVREE
jgi:hypothetical protein